MERTRTVFVVGAFVAIDCPVVLEVMGERIIWITDDDQGRSLFNFTLRDRQGKEAFVMRDNDWIAHPTWDDIEINPEGRSLSFQADHQGIKLRLHFSEESIGAVLNDAHQSLLAGLGFSKMSDPVLVCRVRLIPLSQASLYVVDALN